MATESVDTAMHPTPLTGCQSPAQPFPGNPGAGEVSSVHHAQLLRSELDEALRISGGHKLGKCERRAIRQDCGESWPRRDANHPRLGKNNVFHDVRCTRTPSKETKAQANGVQRFRCVSAARRRRARGW